MNIQFSGCTNAKCHEFVHYLNSMQYWTVSVLGICRLVSNVFVDLWHYNFSTPILNLSAFFSWCSVSSLLHSRTCTNDNIYICKCIFWVSPFLIKCIKNSLSIITVFPYDSVYTGTIESRIIMRTIILRWSVNPRDYSIHLSYFTCMCDTVQYLNSHVTWSLLNLLMTIQMNERLRALHVNTRYCTLSK